MKKLYTDASVCLGCRICEIVCSLAHSGDEVNPRKARIRVREDVINATFKPVVCKQCTKPLCVAACSNDAIRQDPNLGTPIIDREKCTACMACVEACVHEAMFFDEAEKLPLVCDLCHGDPQCVKFCPAHPTKPHAALSYTTREEQAKRRLEEQSRRQIAKSE